jgi:hypothetical protein
MNLKSRWARAGGAAFSLILALAAGARAAVDAEAHKPSVIERYARDYVSTHDTADGLPDYLATLGLPAGMRHDRVVAMANVMLELKKDGVIVDSRAFWDLCAENVGETPKTPIEIVASPSPPSTTAAASAPDAKADSKSGVAAKPKAQKDTLTEPKAGPFTEHAFFHGGARMLSPYTIVRDPADPGANIIQSQNSRTTAFLEFVYCDIWAWRDDRVQYTRDQMKVRYEKDYPGKTASVADRTWEAPTLSDPDVLCDWAHGWDFTTRLGFNFGADKQASAAAIAGSGDINAEVSLDRHLIRGWTQRGNYSVGLGGSAAATTDRSALRVHPYYLVGPSFTVAIADPLSPGDHPRKALIRMRAGPAWIDSVEYADRQRGTIRTVRPDLPYYAARPSKALEAELYYPFNEQSLLTIGTRIFDGVDPSPWSLYLGVTMPIATLADSITPK